MGYPNCDSSGNRELMARREMIPSCEDAEFDGQRKHRRVSWHVEAEIQELTRDSSFPIGNVAGYVLNIGSGGVCVVTGFPLTMASVLRCALKLPGIEITMPTLMQVTWVAACDGDMYVSGMRYVL